MKKYALLLIVTVMSICIAPIRAGAQAQEIAQLLLNIEKLNQLRQILQQLYDGYQIISEGYNKVKDVTSGNYKLHEVFLDGLYLVNPSVKKYYRVADIISYQGAIVKEYKTAYKNFSSSGVFSSNQLDYLAEVYQRLLNESLDNLKELAMILTAGELRMSDDQRLAGIDRVYEDVQQKLLFLRSFNRQHAMIAVEKIREKTELQTIRSLHGLP